MMGSVIRAGEGWRGGGRSTDEVGWKKAASFNREGDKWDINTECEGIHTRQLLQGIAREKCDRQTHAR